MGLSGLPGTGPWRVLAECLAERHNSLAAADGRRSNGKCVCPHALELVRAKRTQDKERLRVRAKSTSRIKMPHLHPGPITAPTYPDFSGGACTTVRGREAAQAGMNEQPSMRGVNDRQRAKNLCNVGPCALRVRCRAWVLSQEEPAGSWGGVWGGLDPWNRRGLQLIIVDGEPSVVQFDLEKGD